jgi:hypothetical protein
VNEAEDDESWAGKAMVAAVVVALALGNASAFGFFFFLRLGFGLTTSAMSSWNDPSSSDAL